MELLPVRESRKERLAYDAQIHGDVETSASVGSEALIALMKEMRVLKVLCEQ
jgi:hypothetical protein